tara:strand:- start:4499 stop:5488 length:990 start_codon:yes stop_codon:yes gene_type:complete
MKKSLLQSGTVSSTTDFLQIGTYTGGGSTDVSVSGLGFRPDLVVLRNLDATSTFSYWIDGNKRGHFVGQAGNEYQYTQNLTNYITHDTDGFTVTTNSGASDLTNKSGDEFLYYAWLLDGNLGDISGSDTAGVYIGKFGGTGGSGSQTYSTGLSSVTFEHKFNGYNFYFKDGTNQDTFQMSNYWTHASQGWSANNSSTGIEAQRSTAYGYYGGGDVDGVSKTDYYNGGNSGSSNQITVGFSPRILMVVRDPATSTTSVDKVWWWSTALDTDTVKYTRYRSAEYSGGVAGKVTSHDSGFGVTFTDTGFYWDSSSESATNASGSRYRYWALG